MIYTARQLEELHRINGNGQVVLPYGARLSPLASDWAKSKKVSVGYSNIEAPTFAVKPVGMAATTQATGDAKPVLWWCDGPCGAAKAAIVAQGKESAISPIDLPPDAKAIVKVIKHLAGEVKAGRASGGVLLVQSGAPAVIFANRCPSLRAIIGTCLEAVEQGIQQVAANVLIIEYPHRTLMQVRNVLSRFARGNRQLSDEVQQQLKDLASCG
jgi:ribose 5-phosphate isomerase RpiB